jgi:hypothetical protein
MKKTYLSIILGFTISALVLIVITSVYPSFDDLFIENPHWNGLSEFNRLLKPERIDNLENLGVYNNPSTLFIIGPDKAFKENEIISIGLFLMNGGRVILADDFGTGNQILEYLGFDARFDGRLIMDTIFKDKNSLMPRVEAGYYGVDYLVLNYPTYLVADTGVVVWSSYLSYAADSVDEEAGNFGVHPIIVEIQVNNGKLILISDSSLFINSMIDKGGNRELLKALAEGVVIIDEIHQSKTITGIVQSLFAKAYTLLGFYEIRYSLLMVFILGILRVNIPLEPKHIDPIEDVMLRHPEYERKELEWLEMERRKEREGK